MPGAALQVHVDVLLAREAEELLDPFLAADAGLLVAAERRAEEVLRHFVDPDEAGLHRSGDAVRGDEIVGPDRARQPVFDLVDLGEHLLLVVPFQDGEHRAKDLFLADAHVHGHVGKHGGLDIETLGEMRIARPLAPAEEARTVLLAGLDVAEHALVLHLAHDRTHGGGGIGRDAGLVALDRILHALEHCVVDPLVHEGAAGRAAALPAPGEVHAVDHGGRYVVDVGIREGDQRVLAAEFQQHRLDRVARRLHHGAAGLDAADERDLVDAGMGGEGGARFSPAGHEAEDALRQQAVDELGQPQRGQRRLVRRLHHDGVAGGERRRRLAGREHEGMIERDDAADHAEWLAHGEVHRVGSHGDRGALHLGDQAGIEIELGRRHRRVPHHLGEGIAAIGGIDHGELVAVLAQDLGDRAQHLGTFERRHPAPFLERGLGRGDGSFGVGHRAVDHLAQRLAGSGADGVDVTFGLGLLPLAGIIGITMRRQIGRGRRLRRGCNCNHWSPPRNSLGCYG